MDAVTNHEASSPPTSLHSIGIESEFNKSSVSLKTSSGGDTFRDSESTGEVLARYELDITYICEKLANLNMLSMQVEIMESDLEAVVSDMDSDLVVKALEYDLLSGFLNSEAIVLESHISDLKIQKANVREFLSSRKHLGEHLVGMEDMLYDSEKSLEQSLEQVVEIKTRSANFERNFQRVAGDEGETGSLNNRDVLDVNEKMKMQSVEHQRHILRMLEKSLGREIDLEKRVSELTQVDETLTMRLHLLERDVNYAEEEAEQALEKFYETDNASDLLMETSRELLSKMKMLQFNLNGAVHREAGLKSALQKLEARVTEYESQPVNEKPSGEGVIKMETTIKDLREQIIVAENRVVNHENKCRELNDAVISLEKELNDVKVKLQHEEACNEASQEDKNMLRSTIKDMDNVIDDMKTKVAQSAVQFDGVEDKCILLSESNAELMKELSFVRGRVKCLETSLHQMEEAKKASAKDINIRSKFITDLVMQMALERERLQKQISTLKQENFFLVKSLKKTDKGPDVTVIHGDKASSTENEFTTENKEVLSTISELEKTFDETVMQSTETIRNIDARQLKAKDIVKVLLILIVPLLGVLVYQVNVR